MSVHRWTVNGFATFAVLLGVFLLSVGQAHASLSEFALSTTIGSLKDTEAIAVDESTGDVYVYDSYGGAINKFDANGNPVNFSGLGSNQITGVGHFGGGEVEMAVDNSAGPASGDIYLAGSFSGVKIYGPDGKALGQLTETAGVPWGEVACGVAVDKTGRVYLGVYPSYVDEYTPVSNPVTNSDYTTSLSGLNEPCNVATDPQGSVYVDTWTSERSGPIVKYVAQAGGSKQVVAGGGRTLAVANSPSAELFVGRNNEIQQYDASGNLLGSFGSEASNGYDSIAVDAKNGRLYAANHASKNIEVWQGVFTPNVQTGQAGNLNAAGSATLTGSVNPEEVPVETCSFQYGTNASYGSIATCAQGTPLTGNSTLAVSADVSEVLPNQEYHYRLSTTDEHGTVDGADQTFTVLVLPTVEDQPPVVSLIARAGAKLTGTIDPERADTRYRFEYGTSESYGNATPFSHTGNSLGDLTVSQQLGELLPDTVYHYRLVADNIAGTVVGADHTFTTGASTPPAAVTGGASGVGQNSATIAGAVDTDGLPTTYGFEVGTSTDYGPPTGLGSVGAGSSEAPVSLALNGLQPGTTYHYRLTASNVDGTSYGADQTFTTGVFANTFATPPAPLPFVAIPSIAFPGEPKAVVVKKKAKAKRKKVNRRKTRGKKSMKKKK